MCAPRPAAADAICTVSATDRKPAPPIRVGRRATADAVSVSGVERSVDRVFMMAVSHRVRWGVVIAEG